MFLRNNFIFQSVAFLLGIINPKIFFWFPFFCNFHVDNLIARETIIFIFLFFPIFLWAIIYENITFFSIIFLIFLLFINLLILLIFKLIEKYTNLNLYIFIRYFQYHLFYPFNKSIIFFYYPLIIFGENLFLIPNGFNFPWILAFIYLKIFEIILNNRYCVKILIFLSIFFLLKEIKEPIKIEDEISFPIIFEIEKEKFLKIIENYSSEMFLLPETAIELDNSNELSEMVKIIKKKFKIAYVGINIKSLNDNNFYEKKNCILCINNFENVKIREKYKKLPFIETSVKNFLFENKYNLGNNYICSEFFLSSFSDIRKNENIILLSSKRWTNTFLTCFYLRLIKCYMTLVEKLNNCMIKSSF